MACFPGLAAAEENSGIQYETDVPTIPDNESSNIPSKKDPGDSKASDESDSNASDSTSPGGAATDGGDDSGTGGSAPSGQGNQATGGDEGKASDGSKPAGGEVGKAQPIQTVSSAAERSTGDDGGSSPLVPILIAVAVLAAISIGAYYYRQRRQGPGSTVTPNAN
jgi:cobalamin biosynthesis Mg chelatase CobN